MLDSDHRHDKDFDMGPRQNTYLGACVRGDTEKKMRVDRKTLTEHDL